ncbi:MAG: FkbM family methyltransferase [Pseudomonadota bacterium]
MQTTCVVILPKFLTMRNRFMEFRGALLGCGNLDILVDCTGINRGVVRMVACQFNLPHRGSIKPMTVDLSDFNNVEKSILSLSRSGQLYETELSQIFLRVLDEGDTVIDVGANVGYFTVLAAALVGPSGRVIAFEPDAGNLSRLHTNIALNRFSHVSVVERPASDSIQEVDFYLNADDSGGSALWDPGLFPENFASRDNPSVRRLTTTTLDHEVGELGMGSPKLVKIDTEGAELKVLEGASSLLADRAVPFVIAELNLFGLERMGGSQAALRGLMEEKGYSTFLPFFNGSLPKLVPPGTLIKTPHFPNILFSTPEMVGRYWPEVVVDLTHWP